MAPINQFFNNYNHLGEQSLFDELVIEAIRNHGFDVFYIKRTDGAIDYIFNEDDLPKYEDVYRIEMYPKQIDAFGGEGDFLSKFGLQVRDQVTLCVAKRTYEKLIASADSSRKRPMEGDLIWLNFCKKLFEITFVEPESIFYQGGALQVYEVRCELFEWTNDELPADDTIWSNLNDQFDTNMVSALDDLKDLDPIANNIDFEDAVDGLVDFSEKDPFSEEITWVKKNGG